MYIYICVYTCVYVFMCKKATDNVPELLLKLLIGNYILVSYLCMFQFQILS